MLLNVAHFDLDAFDGNFLAGVDVLGFDDLPVRALSEQAEVLILA